jgi:hypothetical protein
MYRIVADHVATAGPFGSSDGTQTYPDGSIDVRPSEGRRQRTRPNTLPWLTVQGAVRTLADADTLEELTLWGSEDSTRTFRLDPAAFEVPAHPDTSQSWSYDATSTDGTTHLRIRSRVDDADDVVWLEDGLSTSCDAVRVVSVIEVSGDRTAHLERTVWWSTDLGVAAKIREVGSGTTSKGAAYQRDVTATLRQTTASPESLNRQVAPDEDHDGVPDAADGG